MLIAHAGKHPKIAASAWVAPDATVCGDVIIGPGVRVMYGARVIGEGGGGISIGANSIIMENAVIRGSRRHACTIGDHCLIGPNAHVVGATLEDQVFVAAGAAIFHGAHLGKGAEVRVHATVHLRTKGKIRDTIPIPGLTIDRRTLTVTQAQAVAANRVNVTTVMSSSWPNATAASEACAASTPEAKSVCSRSKLKISPDGVRASNNPSV
jgi:carbonic anhydrase/acetyltransferase-like protein (isoleucine patch superfamily)